MNHEQPPSHRAFYAFLAKVVAFELGGMLLLYWISQKP